MVQRAGEGGPEVPAWQAPREKLRLLGSEALADRDLLALVLGGAGRRQSVFGLADRLLEGAGSFQGLAGLSLAELAAQPGLGLARAARLRALVEICRRMAIGQLRPGRSLHTAAMVYELMRGRLVGENRERVHVLLLDARRRLLGERCVSIGSLMGSLVHPREVFRAAIRRSAASLILVHNHPSGDPTPSAEDHQVTVRIHEAGLLVGIRLLDHVVVAHEGFRSFREEGWLPEG